MKRKWEERLKKVEELASHYERNPFPPVYRPRLAKPSMPSSVWKMFCRQAEAFDYAKTCDEDVHVFALEKSAQSGQRFYLVTTYYELWFYYTKDYKTSLMHCYEVIPEKDPCKLYFDLEFYKPANPGADGEIMVAKLIEIVLCALPLQSCKTEGVFRCSSERRRQKFHSDIPQLISFAAGAVIDQGLDKYLLILGVFRWQCNMAELYHGVENHQLVSQKLKELYDVNCSAKDVLNLDSSTDEKFSRHLIFLLQRTVFKDNTHVGNFVRAVLQPAIRLVESQAAVEVAGGAAGRVSQHSTEGAGSDGSLTHVGDASEDCPAVAHKTKDTEASHQGEDLEFSFLIVNGKGGDKQLFVDLGVYTRNRNFRMYKSSKAGKNVILKIAEDNKFVPDCEANVSLEEAYFLSSLICNVRVKDDTKVLSAEFSEEERKMSAFSKSKPPGSRKDSMEGYQDSPYPEIDCFVRSLVNKDGVQGRIRQWNYFFQEEILVYDISGYRWCENIGRAHKSNNIMILVDLMKEIWYQKCHDPVCRENNFKSQSFPLPLEIRLPSLFREEEEDLLMAERGKAEEKVNPLPSASNLESSSQVFPVSGSEWDNASDDAWFLEATEDVELAEAASHSLDYTMEDIPEEVLPEALRKQDTGTEEDN